MFASDDSISETVRALSARLRSVDLETVASLDLETEVVRLRGALDSLEGEWLRLVAEADRRKVYGRDGHTSATRWLYQAARLAAGTAHRSAGLARRLAEMPLASAALSDGLLSYDQVRVLAGAAEAHPKAFSAGEETLVTSATSLSVTEVTRLVSYWRQPLDHAEGEDSPPPSELYLSATLGGRGRLDGDLDPDDRELLQTALEAATPPPGEEDPRTPSQRRAEALVGICRAYLDAGVAGSTGGTRPHLMLTVELGTLRGEHLGGRCEYGSGAVVSLGTARTLACDSTVCRVLHAGREILELGRSVRVVPLHLRRLVISRDRHCVWPGCERRPAHCDVHHLRPWWAGGPTEPKNLVLVCRRHHTLIHKAGFGIRREADGGLSFTRPDGSEISRRGPPHLAA